MSDQPGLFDEPPPPDGQQIQICDGCMAVEVGSIDHLVVLGWGAFSGRSATGKPLEIRTCPACRRGK